MIENGAKRIAIEIDDEASHNPRLVSDNKFYDDLLKQNSMIHLGWDVYRWAVRQMQLQPDTIKDELRVFLGSSPHFREVTDYLPCQRSKAIEADNLELKEHQKVALNALEEMRRRHETIALIYHATGTGKTVTAVTDAKRIGKRTLFIAHTNELVTQAAETFRALWSEVSTGIYMMVFDFVDNASQYNMPYSLHRLMKLKDYHPGKRVLGTRQQMQEDEELYRKGEKPEALIDYPVSATDYEAVDVFNWQDEAAGMLSQMEFIRRVDVQSETVERYIRDGRIIPDMIVPLSEHNTRACLINRNRLYHFNKITIEAI